MNLFSASLILDLSDLSVSYLLFKTNSVVSILSTFVTMLLYTVFLTTSLFTTVLSLHKSTGTVFHLSAFILSTSVFKLARFDFSAKLLTSTCVPFFKSGFVA